MKAIALAAGSFGAAILVAIFAPAAGAQPLPQCKGYPVAEATYTCLCPANPRKGSVWGSGPYTADSDLCTAAIHSGMLTQAGGSIMAIRTEGQPAYPASERNGISSSRWGRFDHSVTFAPVQAAAAPPAPSPFGTPTPVAPPFMAPAPQPFGTPAPSPFGTPAPANPFQQAQPPAVPSPFPAPAAPPVAAGPICAGLGPDVETRCACPPNAPIGALWGAGPYTGDSDLCTAARHAGAIGPEGGEISIIRVPGLTSYRASQSNGIASMDWGEYGESFIVNSNN